MIRNNEYPVKAFPVPCPSCRHLAYNCEANLFRCAKGDTNDMVGDFSCYEAPAALKAVTRLHPACPECWFELSSDSLTMRTTKPVLVRCDRCGKSVNARFYGD